VATAGRNESSVFRPPILFDPFELDVEFGQVYRSGLPLDLPPQAFRVLVMLAERPGELVTRKEIKEELWPGQSYGDFDSRLNFVVKKLRIALGDDAEQPRYVQTVRSAGYRFVAPVREPTPPSIACDSGDHLEPSQGGVLPESPQETLVQRKWLHVGMSGRVLALMMVAIMSVAGTAMLALRQRGQAPLAIYEVRPRSLSNRPGDGMRIDSITSILPQPRQRMVIKGTGFGLHVPYARTDSPYLAIRDKTAKWEAGMMMPQNWDEVMVDVESWTDTEIVVSGFSGDYGRGGWKLSSGDDLEIAVWNPESGVGPALYHVRVASAP